MDEFIKKYKNYQIDKNIKLNECTNYIFDECLKSQMFFYKYFISNNQESYDKKFFYIVFLIDLSIFLVDIFLSLPNMLKKIKILDKKLYKKFGESLTHLGILTLNSYILNEIYNLSKLSFNLFSISDNEFIFNDINTDVHDNSLIKMRDLYIQNVILFISKLPKKISIDKNELFIEYKNKYNNYLKEKILVK